ncbi:MAG: PAS domain S-box protein, partial [Syntrophales bacterium]|nr:PAS domain S-box protein [Syntrophales bacterium]
MIYYSLINNITLIVSLSILYSLIVRKWEYASKPHRIISGFLFGGVAVIGMMNPLVFSPGLIFDGRSITISIAGFIGGWVTALIAAMMSIAYRAYLGGPGAIMGVSVIASSAVIGIAYYNVRKRRANVTRPIHLVGFGIIVHVCMLILTMTLPSGMKFDVLARIAAPVMTIYPIGTLLVCLVLLEQESRILAEKAFRDSEEKYRELVENANSIILRMDKEGRITFFNEFAEKFFGFRKEDIIGKSVVGTIVPERETTGRDLAAMIGDIGSNPAAYANNENENMRSNGERIWIAWTNRPVLDGNGDVSEILCIGNEITKRKMAEDALRLSEVQLRRIADNMVDLVIQIDARALLQYLTPSVERVLGYHMDDILGKSAFDFIHPDDHDSALLALQEVMKTGYGMVEVRIRHHDGHYVWMELLGNAMDGDNGEKDGIVVGCRDTTGRRRAVEALRESQQQLADIINFLPDATLVIDKEGKVIAWNRAIEEMTGVPAADMLGKGNYEYSLPFYGERRPIIIDLVLQPKEEVQKQ